MCGIVGAATKRDVAGILIEGLQRLEYRGYDSAGLCVLSSTNEIQRIRRAGKVAGLRAANDVTPAAGALGIAHTRWATHGKPTENNAHPHLSRNEVGVVHNGIIENHEDLRAELQTAGYSFASDTDTEVIAHLVHREVDQAGDFRKGVELALDRLEGAYAVGVMHRRYPDRIIGVRLGSPLVVGLGFGENFIASDPQALRPVTDRFIFLEEGEIAEISAGDVSIFGLSSESVQSRAVRLDDRRDASNKGSFRHYMLKEIYEQPETVAATLAERVTDRRVLEHAFGIDAPAIFAKAQAVQIVACGSSYYSSLVARYWIEQLTGLPCSVEIASEIRYRKAAVQPDTLFVTISQSGETADTLAAFRHADGYLASLCICNVPNSTLVRESDLSLMIHAGPEIGVASTKAFTNQLTDLLLLTLALGRNKSIDEAIEAEIVGALRALPSQLQETLKLSSEIAKMSEDFVEKQNALFLGRGSHFPIALEGALKLKEISYIHAEGYPAGELKHGPLALVDDDMPVVTVAPNDELLEKLKSNMQEVRARGGQLYVFADRSAVIEPEIGIKVIKLPESHPITSPIVHTVPMQLLAYHVAVLKGTDIDQPRNLAKSVTVE